MTAMFTKGSTPSLRLLGLGLLFRVMARIFGPEPASGEHPEVQNYTFVRVIHTHIFYTLQKPDAASS